ncbi:SDR family NAD(P)-dependent oxidoreductase [Mycobacterium koreense]|uniref:Uncharacterized protein n=1 Tax=Mycolicibacillus koreensis TaxID=1069220 RepID=A0A7I7S9A2_9MYCO|nr:SDR family NAD(P)-dependent oxidoreductase [Mycolicibacillus koreensis]MCV7247057.1 SDR family NAD(P)-dependent oxidoreductase [Mycolicibacillus koreensis]OSC35076.1 hypothetical protein B8W67_04645 [Mycolicibacillus koreensis]BBY53464.1 short-chain dehydrogenase [Mycolicibacillus koreensis]
MTQVTGLRVAITGGAQGIGRALGQALTASGARVALGDIQDAAVMQTATDLGAVGRHLDVTDPESFESFLDEAATELGGLDALINNAGIMPIGPLLAESPDVIRRAVEVNLLGMITGTRLAGRRFADRGRGHVLNIASVMGAISSPNAATYCATKSAVIGFSAALRQEWRTSGVVISAICPGFVRTELIAGMTPPRLLERFMVVDPDDVARAAITELRRGSSRTVFVPRPVGWIARGTGVLPTALVDGVFRLAGGEKVTAGIDHTQRAAYRARIEGRDE